MSDDGNSAASKGSHDCIWRLSLIAGFGFFVSSWNYLAKNILQLSGPERIISDKVVMSADLTIVVAIIVLIILRQRGKISVGLINPTSISDGSAALTEVKSPPLTPLGAFLLVLDPNSGASTQISEAVQVSASAFSRDMSMTQKHLHVRGETSLKISPGHNAQGFVY